jgi:hypothetical protein
MFNRLPFLTLQSARDLTLRNRRFYTQDGHTAALQTLPFMYFFNQYMYWIFLNMLHNLHFFLFKIPFISYATFFGSCIIRILHTGCAKI